MVVRLGVCLHSVLRESISLSLSAQRAGYKSNGRRLDRLETSLARLLPVFGNVPVTRIGGDRIENYKAKRKAEGVCNATIDRELTALRRALNLGKQQLKVAYVPPIDMLEESRRGKGSSPVPNTLPCASSCPTTLSRS